MPENGFTTEEDYSAGSVPADWGWGGEPGQYEAWGWGTPGSILGGGGQGLFGQYEKEAFPPPNRGAWGQYELGSKTVQEWQKEAEARLGVEAWAKGPLTYGIPPMPIARSEIPASFKSTNEVAALVESRGGVVFGVEPKSDVLGQKGSIMTAAFPNGKGGWTPYTLDLNQPLYQDDFINVDVLQLDKDGNVIGIVTERQLDPNAAPHISIGAITAKDRPGQEGFMGDWKKPHQIDYTMSTGRWGEPRPLVSSYQPGVQPEPTPAPAKDWREQLIRNYSEDEWNEISTSDKASIFNYVETVMRMNRSDWLARMMAGWSRRRPTVGVVRPSRR